MVRVWENGWHRSWETERTGLQSCRTDMRFNNRSVFILEGFSLTVSLGFSLKLLWEKQPVWAEWEKLCLL